jgi:hypothetical protein
MRNQWLQIHQFTLYGCDACGPGIGVSVDEFDIDLVHHFVSKDSQKERYEQNDTHLSQTDMHERDVVDHWPAHANHHNRTASPDSKRCSNNTALHTRTLKHSLWAPILGVSKQLSYLLCIVLGTQVALHLVSFTLRNQLLGKGKAFGFEVGDDEGVCARSTRREKSNKTDGTGAADYSATT